MKMASFGVSQTCLGTNVLSGMVPSTFLLEVFLGTLGALCRGKGAPWHGTSAQPESHLTCSSPRCASRGGTKYFSFEIIRPEFFDVTKM